MKHQLIAYFEKITPLSAEESAALEASMNIITAPAGTFLLEEGKTSDNTYFVLKGCVREFVMADGDERTTNFFTENQWVIALNNHMHPTAADVNWVCTEDTTLVTGNEEKAMELFMRFPRFESISRKVMEEALHLQREQIRVFLTHAPDERYEALLTSRPDLIQRVPQYQLASYIGVKPESLSRIRKRISKRKS